MSGIWKNNIGLSIFGESHGPVVGITIDGLQPGMIIDEAYIQSELDRRRPGQNDLVTPRKETDAFEILSGVFEGKTTGAPLTMVIQNKNIRSKDYSKTKDLMRPGHADYTGLIKYGGYGDYRGGGHFSGRLTAGLVFAGAIAKSILKSSGIAIAGQITKIGMVRDDRVDRIDSEWVDMLLSKSFPTASVEAAEEMKSAVREARDDHDSIGGEIRCFAVNVPPGLGNPYFNSFESVLSQLIFSIPAIKGIAFGSGFRMSEMHGSTANDAFYFDGDHVKTKTNHNGGILGGITNGMPIDFTVAVKPTPSIGKVQATINMATHTDENLAIQGRHDPCIVPRVVPVVEAVLAIAILDSMLKK